MIVDGDCETVQLQPRCPDSKEQYRNRTYQQPQDVTRLFEHLLYILIWVKLLL